MPSPVSFRVDIGLVGSGLGLQSVLGRVAPLDMKREYVSYGKSSSNQLTQCVSMAAVHPTRALHSTFCGALSVFSAVILLTLLVGSEEEHPACKN